MSIVGTRTELGVFGAPQTLGGKNFLEEKREARGSERLEHSWLEPEAELLGQSWRRSRGEDRPELGWGLGTARWEVQERGQGGCHLEFLIAVITQCPPQKQQWTGWKVKKECLFQS